jgi:predicted nucleic acid-binding protein
MSLILADTSVWADHFRGGDPLLAECLARKRIRMHPFIIGELAMGELPRREQTLEHLKTLHRIGAASDVEVLRLVDAGRHYATGLSWIDIHLLAAVLLREDISLWTRDRRLNEAAMRYGRATHLHH